MSNCIPNSSLTDYDLTLFYLNKLKKKKRQNPLKQNITKKCYILQVLHLAHRFDSQK